MLGGRGGVQCQHRSSARAGSCARVVQHCRPRWGSCSSRPRRRARRHCAGECGRRSYVRDQGRQHDRLLGLERLRAGDAAPGNVQGHRRGRLAHVRDPDRRHRDVLGQERRRRVNGTPGHLFRRQRRRRPQLRATDRPHSRLLGTEHPVAPIQRGAGRLLRLRQRGQHRGHHLELRGQHRQRHHLLGLQLLRSREPAAWHVQRRRSRSHLRVRPESRQRHGLLGRVQLERHTGAGAGGRDLHCNQQRATTSRAASGATRRSTAMETTPRDGQRPRPGPSAP